MSFSYIGKRDIERAAVACRLRQGSRARRHLSRGINFMMSRYNETSVDHVVRFPSHPSLGEMLDWSAPLESANINGSQY